MTDDKTKSNGFGRLNLETDDTGRMIKDPPTPKKKPSLTRHERGYLEHYLGGSGAEMTIPPEDMDKSGSLKDAMKTNRNRFEESMTKGGVTKKDGSFHSHPFKEQIINMKDGETKTLEAPNSKGNDKADKNIDTWDRDIKPGEHLLKFDPRKELGLGHVKVKSEGKFEATRTGDIVEIRGKVDHKVKDRYDFSENFMFGYFKNKETEGEAKSFDIKGKKSDKVHGNIKIENGDIKDANFKWDDAN